MKKLAFFLLLLTAGGLGELVLSEFSQPVPKNAPSPEPAAAPPPPEGGRGAAEAPPDRTPGLVATILARPLFEANRRPPATVGAAADAAPRASLPRVSGIVVSAQGRSAIFAASGGARAIVAGEGTRIGDYVVKSIGANEVVVAGPDGTHSLHPTFDPAARNAAAPQGIAAPPFGAGPFGAPAAGGIPAFGRFGLPNLLGQPNQQTQPGAQQPSPQPGLVQPNPFQPGAFRNGPVLNRPDRSQSSRPPYGAPAPSLAGSLPFGQYAER